METVAGIFTTTRAAREGLARLRARGLGDDHLTLFLPGTPEHVVEATVATEDAEPPGMGAAVGGVIGGAVGLATASVLLPGVGPVVIAGLLAAAVAGAAGGGAVGDRIEERLTNGIPHDELRIYEAALRRGRAVLIAAADTDAEAIAIRETLHVEGAESVDAAREDWLTGLRGPGQ